MLILDDYGLDENSCNYQALVRDIENHQDYFEKQRKRDKELLDRANEWYLRAEVIKLTSHGISMTVVSADSARFEQEVLLLWPEHHQLQLHGAKPSISLFTFFSPHAGRLKRLRKALYHRRHGGVHGKLKAAVGSIKAAHRLSKASHSHFSMPGYLDRYHQDGMNGMHPAEREYLLSLNPNAEQLDDMLAEKFNIGGKSGAPLYFSHDLEFVIKAVPKEELDFVSSWLEYYGDFSPLFFTTLIHCLILSLPSDSVTAF